MKDTIDIVSGYYTKEKIHWKGFMDDHNVTSQISLISHTSVEIHLTEIRTP